MEFLDAVSEYAEQLKQANSPVRVYDFGDSTTVMPTPSGEPGGYLRTSICYLSIEKEPTNGDLDWLTPFSPKQMEKVWEYGTGNFYIGVEIHNEDSPEKIRTALDAAKAKLLRAKGEAT